MDNQYTHARTISAARILIIHQADRSRPQFLNSNFTSQGIQKITNEDGIFKGSSGNGKSRSFDPSLNCKELMALEHCDEGQAYGGDHPAGTARKSAQSQHYPLHPFMPRFHDPALTERSKDKACRVSA